MALNVFEAISEADDSCAKRGRLQEIRQLAPEIGVHMYVRWCRAPPASKVSLEQIVCVLKVIGENIRLNRLCDWRGLGET